VQVDAPVKREVNEIKGKPIPGIQNIIAVASGKGGVGKSTIAANIAVSLSKMGFRVGLLDADIYGPSMPTMFDVADEKPRATNVDGKSRMLPIEQYGVKMLSIGFFTQPNQAVIWRGPMAAKALNQMIFDAHWGTLDFLLLDLPPGTGDIHLSIMQAMPVTGAVIVSTPQEVALADARKGVAMFQQESINVPVLGIVENMAYFTPEELPDNKYYIFGMGGARNLADDMEIPFLGEIPLVQSIREAGDAGRPAALQTATPIESAFEELTRNVVSELVRRNEQLPPTEAIKITTMAGCSAVKKK
jgi:ATP-binding protein involved in chromosome partitioning